MRAAAYVRDKPAFTPLGFELSLSCQYQNVYVGLPGLFRKKRIPTPIELHIVVNAYAQPR
jgi:hypothetical protein